MALYTVIDFEATSQFANQAHPLSLSYYTFEKRNFFKPVESGTLFFWKDGVSISAENQAIHGLSPEFLAPHAPMYAQNCRKLWKLCQHSYLVGQNIKQFDFILLKNFLLREGYPEVEPRMLYDTRWSTGSSKKQSEMLLALEVENEDILGYWDMMFPNSIFDKSSLSAHNGEFDVVGTLLLFIDAVHRGKFNLPDPKVVPQSNVGSTPTLDGGTPLKEQNLQPTSQPTSGSSSVAPTPRTPASAPQDNHIQI